MLYGDLKPENKIVTSWKGEQDPVQRLCNKVEPGVFINNLYFKNLTTLIYLLDEELE